MRAPVAVRVAAGTLVLMALTGLGYGIAVLASLNGIVERFRAGAAGSGADPAQVDAVVTLAWLGAWANLAVAVPVAVLLIALAVGLLAGRARARIGTWVVCGFGLICGCGAVAGLVTQRAVPLRFSGEMSSVADLLRILVDAYPAWWMALAGGLSVAQSLGYLLVAVLLAVSPADAFPAFPRPPGWPTPAAPSGPSPQPAPPSSGTPPT